MAHVVTISVIVADGGIIAQAPVAENPDDLAVHTDRLALFDDQRTVQAAADLLEAALVRVVPICASIRQVEGIGEGLARSDRLLRPVRGARWEEGGLGKEWCRKVKSSWAPVN